MKCEKFTDDRRQTTSDGNSSPGPTFGPGELIIPGLSDLSNEDRLRRLKLLSLSYRRSRGDMIEVYKIMSGKYDPEISNIFQNQEQENRNTRGHKYKLFKPRCRLNIRKNSFCIRVVNMWNSLSENVV